MSLWLSRSQNSSGPLSGENSLHVQKRRRKQPFQAWYQGTINQRPGLGLAGRGWKEQKISCKLRVESCKNKLKPGSGVAGARLEEQKELVVR